jgi:hypothetical protein
MMVSSPAKDVADVAMPPAFGKSGGNPPLSAVFQ